MQESIHHSRPAVSVSISTVLDTEIPGIADDSCISPVAELQTINFERLAGADPNEADKLFRACQRNSFFYLDLHRSNHNRRVLDIVGGAFAVSRALFVPYETEEISYDVDKLGTMKLNGYNFLGDP